MNHRHATKFLADNPKASLVYSDRDATLNHRMEIDVWLDDDHTLVQHHPTDPKRGPIAAPTDVRFSTPFDPADDPN